MLNFGDIRACLVHMIENMCFVVWLKFKWIWYIAVGFISSIT